MLSIMMVPKLGRLLVLMLSLRHCIVKIFEAVLFLDNKVNNLVRQRNSDEWAQEARTARIMRI